MIFCQFADCPDIQEILQRISEITVQRVEETGILDEKDGLGLPDLGASTHVRLRRSPAGGVLSPEALGPNGTKSPLIVVHICSRRFPYNKNTCSKAYLYRYKTRWKTHVTYRAKYGDYCGIHLIQ